MNPDSHTSIEHGQSYRAAFGQMQPAASGAPWLQVFRERALEGVGNRAESAVV